MFIFKWDYGWEEYDEKEQKIDLIIGICLIVGIIGFLVIAYYMGW